MYVLFQLNPISFYPLFSYFLLLVTLRHTNSLKWSSILIHTLISIVVTILFFAYKDIRILVLLSTYLRIIIFFNFTFLMVHKLINRNILYSYFLVLIYNEFTVIAKSALFIFNIHTAIPLIYMLNIIDMAVAIYFILFNLKNISGLHMKPQT
jgi:hypothetical protein